MSTVIYPSPIFGPVHSRRLGVSLGVNLMPPDGKVCTFDCLYCECGFNRDFPAHDRRPTREEVHDALKAVLLRRHTDGEPLDCITFSGNGEPTGHPDFPDIITDTVALRDRFFPEAKVSVLSNATFAGSERVRNALMLVDNNIMKLDTVDADYIRMVDRPVQKGYDVRKVVESLKMFKGHVMIQTMFMTGTADGRSVDNTGDRFIVPWLETLREIGPCGVMIYTVDRETPAHGLRKASPQVLDDIRNRVEAMGIRCSVAY